MRGNKSEGFSIQLCILDVACYLLPFGVLPISYLPVSHRVLSQTRLRAGTPCSPQAGTSACRHEDLISKKSDPSKYAQFYPYFSVLVNRRITQKLFNSIRLPNSTPSHPLGKDIATILFRFPLCPSPRWGED
jgi:hypothetical protein